MQEAHDHEADAVGDVLLGIGRLFEGFREVLVLGHFAHVGLFGEDVADVFLVGVVGGVFHLGDAVAEEGDGRGLVPDVPDQREKFLGFHKVLEELFPLVHRELEKTEIDGNLLFYWKGKGSGELEFIIESDNKVYPIDVKKGKGALNSLGKFANHNRYELAIKVSKNNYGYDAEHKLLTVPFYYFPFVAQDLADGNMRVLKYL